MKCESNWRRQQTLSQTWITPVELPSSCVVRELVFFSFLNQSTNFFIVTAGYSIDWDTNQSPNLKSPPQISLKAPIERALVVVRYRLLRNVLAQFQEQARARGGRRMERREEV